MLYGKVTNSITYKDGKPVIDATVIHEKFNIDDHNGILAKTLTLLERYQRGEIRAPGTQVIEVGGKPKYIELIWTDISSKV